jgi:hypothetical protein
VIGGYPSHMTYNLLTSCTIAMIHTTIIELSQTSIRPRASRFLPDYQIFSHKHKSHHNIRSQQSKLVPTMATPPTPLTRFKEAMQSVYGPFENLSSSELSKWTPPAKYGGHRGRYLWTDAFGVLNFLTLYRITSSPLYLHLAKSLIQSVHSILGSTRDGKSQLPGATDAEPLKGGLRIGKIDESGSDGDGMYHHYLTLWMFALNRLSVASKEMGWNELAIQLAKAIHRWFVITDTGGRKRMVWKISTDMKRVLVSSEGHLDAATGFVVFKLLQEGKGEEVLRDEVEEYRELMMREGKLTASTDALDLGMALWMCHFFAEEEEWAKNLGEKCLANCSK